jgi:chemotaxis signal transduction protein
MQGAELHQEQVSHIGWVSVGGFQFAIAVAHLYRAIQISQPLVSVPRRQGAVAGLLDTGEGTLPVVDLRLWLKLDKSKPEQEAATPEAGSVVLHLCDGQRQIGILVSRVNGIQAVPDGALKRIHHQSDTEEIFDQIVQWDALPQALPLLESGKLMNLLQIWLEQSEHLIQNDQLQQQEQQQQIRRKGVILAAGNKQVWLDAQYVRELIPAQKILGAQTQSLHNWAVLRWRGLPVPLVSGFASADARRSGYVAIVGLESGETLGILADQLLRLSDWQSAGALDDVGDEGNTDAQLFPEVMLDKEQEPVFLMELPELFRRHPEAMLAKAAGTATTTSTQNTARRNRVPYIIFDADGVFAIGADRIQEIVAVNQTPTEDGIEWRGRWIPFVPLADWYPLPQAGSGQTEKLAILSGSGDQITAYGIHALRMMVPAGRGKFHAWPGKVEQEQILEIPVNGSYTMATVVNWSQC